MKEPPAANSSGIFSAEPGDEETLAAEGDDAGVAVVEEGVVDDHRDAPGPAAVIAAIEAGFAERADVADAEAGVDGIEDAVLIDGDARPAVITEKGMRGPIDDPVFCFGMNQHDDAPFGIP